jgi:two-component system chemotaxis response regulator CheY
MAKTVLAVDDSVSIRMMVSFTLQQCGYAVIEAEDGMAGLMKLRNQIVDMVITDLNMPRLDGISFIRSIRAQPDYRHTPVVMLTTEFQDASKQQAREAGATGWITKPFRPEQLLAVVRKMIG